MLLAAGLLALLGARWALGQAGGELPEKYRKYFVHYVDRRSLPEKALNLLGLTSQEAGRSFALIAGVDTYPRLQGAERRLEPAEVDMANLAAYLKDFEFFDEIVVLRNEAVTEENFRAFLQAYFPARLRQFPRSRFLFAYSGHGLQDGSRGYLLQANATNLKDKLNAISMEGLRVLYGEVAEAAHHSLALINACHSGGFGRSSFGGARLIPQERGAHAITAGGTTERSWHYESVGPGSVFFEKLFAGLDGRADTFPEQGNGSPGDGVVTVEELIGYLKPQVQQETEQAQNPILGDLDREGSRGSFFFLNRRRQLQARTVREWKSARRSMGPSPGLAEEPDRREAVAQAKPPKIGIVTRPQPVAPPPVVPVSGWGPREAGAVEENSLGMRFRSVPPGRFRMGSPWWEEGRLNTEGPRHEVVLSRGFWLGETEVTQGQWSALVGKNPSLFSACGENCPVERVNWWEAVEFANRLSAREGLPGCYELSGCTGTLGAMDFACKSVVGKAPGCTGYRLPTEAEWEYVARAGTSSARYQSDVGAIAWYGGNSGDKTHAVGGKPANAWGLHDMLGNASEWCQDFFEGYSSDLQRDPGGPSSGSRRVIRGGSWPDRAWAVRAAVRGGVPPSNRYHYQGFRLARTQAAPNQPASR